MLFRSFALFWGVALVWLSGLIGNAHHYFWIGTPEFWQFWGSLFSALEPLPLIFCFWHIYLDAHHDRRPLKNAPAFYFILGSVVLEQVGAGILGFTMTFALTNVWRSEEHTSELQSLMRSSYAVFCLKT